MLIAERARFEAGFSGHWHDHPRAQLIYPEQGVMVLHTGQGQWVTPPLQACWLPRPSRTGWRPRAASTW